MTTTTSSSSQLLCDELRAPLRRAAADETFQASANSAERGVAYLKLFTEDAEEPSTPVQTTPHVLSFEEDGHFSRDSSLSDEPLGELASWRWDALRVADDGGEEALVEAAQMMFEHHGELPRSSMKGTPSTRRDPPSTPSTPHAIDSRPRKEFPGVPGDGAVVVQGYEFLPQL